MSRQYVISVLGRRDYPTDAVEEYCKYLGVALREHDCDLLIERVDWEGHGWRAALRSLLRRVKGWRNPWVLVQYTALAWSKRGFPFRFLRVLKILRATGVRVGVVYHDVEPFGGTRVIDRLRQWAQVRTMREALRVADVAIFTVPPEKLFWYKRGSADTEFIPVGANFPASGEANLRKGISPGGKPSIAVFGVTGGAAGRKEIEAIVDAVRFAASRVKNLRLIVFGRNAQSAEPELQKLLSGTGVELHVLGVLAAEDVVRTLSVSDVLLFVRGHISSRRSSAIAGIACGLPVIAYEGQETAAPITEAGLALYSPQRKGDLGDVLVRVLEDEHHRISLAQRSWRAQREYFSWRAIAAQYAKFLRKEN